jgi:hypothetical protein
MHQVCGRDYSQRREHGVSAVWGGEGRDRRNVLGVLWGGEGQDRRNVLGVFSWPAAISKQDGVFMRTVQLCVALLYPNGHSGAHAIGL